MIQSNGRPFPASSRSALSNGNAAHSAKKPALTRAQINRLAEFRFQLRRFLSFSGRAAEGAGIRPQQYQLLQCVCGLPDELEPTIANVAARMLLKHNSAVELVDRTIDQGLLRRCPDPTDHRRILLRVTPEGQDLLDSLVSHHIRELEEAGPELIRALRRILLTKSKPIAMEPAHNKRLRA